MCLIVDANSVSQVFLKRKAKFERLHRAIVVGKARLVYGGELTREYRKICAFWRLLVTLDRQGVARQVDGGRVDRETDRLRATNACRSDDPHIIALARVAQARLICSDDQKLREDVRDPELLANPRGNIYNESDHQRLLRKHCTE